MSDTAHLVAGDIATLRARINRIERDWRLLHLPPPSRDSPRPDADAIRVAQLLEQCGRHLDGIGGRLRTLPPGRGDAGEALRDHLDFLVALTDGDPALDPQALLDSIVHLEALLGR